MAVSPTAGRVTIKRGGDRLTEVVECVHYEIERFEVVHVELVVLSSAGGLGQSPSWALAGWGPLKGGLTLMLRWRAVMFTWGLNLSAVSRAT